MVPSPPPRAIVARGFAVSHVGLPRWGLLQSNRVASSDELFTIKPGNLPRPINSIFFNNKNLIICLTRLPGLLGLWTRVERAATTELQATNASHLALFPLPTPDLTPLPVSERP
jgi:hypothetical protein